MELINDSRNNIIATSNFTNAWDEVYVEGIDSHLKNMSKDKSLFDKDSSEFIGISKISIRLFNF